MPDALQQRCQHIVTSPVLTPEQKRHFLALEAENNLPYPALPEAARAALDEGFICDMFEGHAPYKPRYVLPDYAKFLANGSEWLELEGAKDLDDALSLLTILYHHVPSVTSMPVYLGQLDEILSPYVKILTQDEIDSRIKRFWRYGQNPARCVYACQYRPGGYACHPSHPSRGCRTEAGCAEPDLYLRPGCNPQRSAAERGGKHL